MSLPEDHPYAHILQNFLARHYPPELEGPNFSEPQTAYPLTFHHHHLAPNLLLKSVKSAPWLFGKLEALFDAALEEYVNSGTTFEVEDCPSLGRINTQVKTATDVCSLHGDVIGDLCCAYASKMIFYPHGWVSLLRVYEELGQSVFRHKGGYGVLDPKTIEDNPKIPVSFVDNVEDWVLPTIVKLRELRSIANAEYFVTTKEGEMLIQKIAPISTFNWKQPATRGAPSTVCSPAPGDSAYVGSIFPEIHRASAETARSSKKSTSRPFKDERSRQKYSKKIIPAPRTNRVREKHYRINVSHFLQVAWHEAVMDDVTFIIFNCGRYQRIGIRHRQTQTLYISDLINTTNAAGFAKIELGLTIAFVKDAIERVDRGLPPIYAARSHIHLKRLAEENLMKSSKRRKLSREVNATTQKVFNEEVSKREIMLLRLDVAPYHSPAPTSFLRLKPSCALQPLVELDGPVRRKPRYSPQSAILLTIDGQHIGYGSTGMVFRVIAELETEAGQRLERLMVLKVTLWDDDANDEVERRILNEYHAYMDLAAYGMTEGIVKVYGLFQDTETGMFAILMDEAGKSLRELLPSSLEPLPKDAKSALEEYYRRESYKVTEDQRDSFIDIMTAMHKAGVVHNDIRLENLMLHDDGHVSIIDFSNAIRSKDRFIFPDAYVTEMRDLLQLIGWKGHKLPQFHKDLKRRRF